MGLAVKERVCRTESWGLDLGQRTAVSPPLCCGQLAREQWSVLHSKAAFLVLSVFTDSNLSCYLNVSTVKYLL